MSPSPRANVEGAADDQTAAITPASPKARRTRSRLIDASRVVFERDGFLNARIVDIADSAGVAIGSFYTYFKSKREIFLALMEQVQQEMLHPPRITPVGESKSIRSSVEMANREYFESYRHNAALMAVLEEVAAIDPGFREVRLNRSVAFTERNARMIARLQAEGIADADLDPRLAARSLSGMVSRAAHHAFVLNPDDDVEALAVTLTCLWLNALGIDKVRREQSW